MAYLRPVETACYMELNKDVVQQSVVHDTDLHGNGSVFIHSQEIFDAVELQRHQ